MEKQPLIMLLDGDYHHTLNVASELKCDLKVKILGVGSSSHSALLRSRYCDYRAVLPVPGGSGYPGALLRLIEQHEPDLVLPIGYRSVLALSRIYSNLPASVKTCIPSGDSLEAALNKTLTLQLAKELGIGVPHDFSDLVRNPGSGNTTELPYPLFLKASREAGRNIIARVDTAADLWNQYIALEGELEDGGILVQEYINGDNSTYACGVLFLDGEPVMIMGHEEVRSVPREGGSGTRVKLAHNQQLVDWSLSLLKALDWNGIALVEYKRRRDGTYALMEINPKFWASYALASKYGYRFASVLVSRILRLKINQRLPRTQGEMAFPLRELAYCLKHWNEESAMQAIAAMIWPPARWDIDLLDLPAWLPTRLAVRHKKITGVE